MLSRALPLVAAVSMISLLVQLTASVASAAFNPPTFVRQWEIAPTGPPDFNSAEAIAVDAFGDVYVLKPGEASAAAAQACQERAQASQGERGPSGEG